jgi:hypothetical protein
MRQRRMPSLSGYQWPTTRSSILNAAPGAFITAVRLSKKEGTCQRKRNESRFCTAGLCAAAGGHVRAVPMARYDARRGTFGDLLGDLTAAAGSGAGGSPSGALDEVILAGPAAHEAGFGGSKVPRRCAPAMLRRTNNLPLAPLRPLVLIFSISPASCMYPSTCTALRLI